MTRHTYQGMDGHGGTWVEFSRRAAFRRWLNRPATATVRRLAIAIIVVLLAISCVVAL